MSRAPTINHNRRLWNLATMRAEELQEAEISYNNHEDDDGDLLYRKYIEQFNRGAPLDYNKFLYKFNRISTIFLGRYICASDLMGGYETFKNFESVPLTKCVRRLGGNAVSGRTNGRRRLAEDAKIAISDCGHYAKNESTTISRRFFPGALGWPNILCFCSWAWAWLPWAQRKSSWYWKLRMGWISSAIMIAAALFELISMLDVTYLYEHDISCLRLERAQDLIKLFGPQARVSCKASNKFCLFDDLQPMSLEQFEQILTGRANETRHKLSYLGDKFINWGIINECLYLSLMALGFVMCFVFPFIFTWLQRFEIPFHRDLLNHEDEERRSEACCEEEILKYLESNRMYNLIMARQVYSDTWRSRSSNLRVCRMLTQMLLAGAFKQPNRSNLWIEQRNYTQAAITFVIPIYVGSFFAAAIFSLYNRAPTGFDLGETCELSIIILSTCAITYYLSTFLISCLIQVKLTNHNLNLIYDCINSNERQFGLYTTLAIVSNGKGGFNLKHKHQYQRKARIIADKINLNYLFVLMTYKLFVRQLITFKRTFWGIFPLVFSLAFVVPVIARIHVPYLIQDESDSGNKERLSGFIISLLILFPVNLVCLPFCYVHSRCVKLYKALASLMAHIIRVGARDNNLCKTIYDEHAVIVLIKELSNPKLMLEQFVVSSFSFNATFPTLVRLHFWWSFLALSILVDTQSSNNQDAGSLVSFLADPLDVWNFHVMQAEEI